MHDPELPPSPEPETPLEYSVYEVETIPKTFEYRDAEGRLICRAEAVYFEFEIEVPTHDTTKKLPGHVLKSLVLHGEKDGIATEIDVLALANRHGMGISVAENLGARNCYSDADRRIFCDPLDNPATLAILLHELGHADQYRDPDFAQITPLSDLKKQLGDGSLTETLKRVVRAVPELGGLADDQTLEKLEADLARLKSEDETLGFEFNAAREKNAKDFLASKGALERFFGTLDSKDVKEALYRDVMDESLTERLKRIAATMSPKVRAAQSAKLAVLEASVRETEIRISQAVKGFEAMQARRDQIERELRDLKQPFLELLGVPLKLIERDATARAFRWMRQMRDEAGIDLFRQIRADRRAFLMEEGESCEQDLAAAAEADATGSGVVDSTVSPLHRGLKSYRADRFRFRKSPDDLGFMPNPKRDKKT